MGIPERPHYYNQQGIHVPDGLTKPARKRKDRPALPTLVLVLWIPTMVAAGALGFTLAPRNAAVPGDLAAVADALVPVMAEHPECGPLNLQLAFTESVAAIHVQAQGAAGLNEVETREFDIAPDGYDQDLHVWMFLGRKCG